MNIWFIDFDDLSCAWTKKEDAIKYFKEEAKSMELSYQLMIGDESDENAVEYQVYSDKDDIEFAVLILPTFLDEKPYFYPERA